MRLSAKLVSVCCGGFEGICAGDGILLARCVGVDQQNYMRLVSVYYFPLQGVWLPELQKMVEAINTTFTKNFASIGCVGEISLQDDIDYDKFAIQIR